MCKDHSKDQDVCCLVLQLLAKLVPHLCAAEAAGQRVSESTIESRDIALGLLAVFWRRSRSSSQYSRRMRMAVAQCVTVFAQVGNTHHVYICMCCTSTYVHLHVRIWEL